MIKMFIKRYRAIYYKENGIVRGFFSYHNNVHCRDVKKRVGKSFRRFTLTLKLVYANRALPLLNRLRGRIATATLLIETLKTALPVGGVGNRRRPAHPTARGRPVILRGAAAVAGRFRGPKPRKYLLRIAGPPPQLIQLN